MWLSAERFTAAARWPLPVWHFPDCSTSSFTGGCRLFPACVVAALLAPRGREFAAGLALGLLVFKPHWALTAGAVFLVAREWRVVSGIAIAAIGQVALTYAVVGSSVMSAYWRVLRSLPRIAELLEPRPGDSLKGLFQAFAPSQPVAFALYGVAALVTLVLAARIWRSRASVEVRCSAIVLALVLANPHVNGYDLLLFAPVYFLLTNWLVDAAFDHRTEALPALLCLSFLAPLLTGLPSVVRAHLRHPHIRHPLMPYPLAAEEVNYVGELVAAVLADNRYIAEDAASLVTVDYEVLSPVVDCRVAIEPGSPRAHANVSDNIAAKFTLGYGNVDAAFETAHTVVEVALTQQRGSGHAIECRAVLANYDKAGDKLTVWNAGQTPHIDHRNLEILLRLDPSQLRVIMPDVGGGFGTKALFYPETAVVAWCALALERPVKWIEDRRENFLAATQERDQYWDLALALARDGEILGLRGRLVHDGGAYVPHGIVLPLIAGTTVPGRMWFRISRST
jgi:hypothetical protein